MRIEIGQLDKDLAIEQAETMAAKIQGQTSALRFVSVLMGIFGIIALLLCAMGVYGIVANSVNKRRREIGIRMAPRGTAVPRIKKCRCEGHVPGSRGFVCRLGRVFGVG